MTTLGVVVTVILLMAVIELAVGSLKNLQRKHWRHVRQVEQMRAHFADVRQRASEMACKGELDPKSQTFTLVYRTSTFVMRRPEFYPLIGSAMACVSPKEGDDELRD